MAHVLKKLHLRVPDCVSASLLHAEVDWGVGRGVGVGNTDRRHVHKCTNLNLESETSHLHSCMTAFLMLLRVNLSSLTLWIFNIHKQ